MGTICQFAMSDRFSGASAHLGGADTRRTRSELRKRSILGAITGSGRCCGPLWRTYYLPAQYGPRATSAVKGVVDSFCFFWRCFADVSIPQALYVCEEDGHLPGELTLHRVMRSTGVHGHDGGSGLIFLLFRNAACLTRSHFWLGLLISPAYVRVWIN